MRGACLGLVGLLIGCGAVVDPKPDAPVVEGDVALTVITQGTGVGSVTSVPSGIDCGASCSAIYDADTVVTLTASTTTGTSFMGWSGGGCSGVGSCITTLSAAQTVIASFNCDTASQTFAFTGATETFTAPVCATTVRIVARGAQGGNGDGTVGGMGAQIEGTFAVTGPLTVLVGGRGGSVSNGNGGGGGGSYVFTSAASVMPLIVAGGGGGTSSNGAGCAAGPGSANETPTVSTGGSGNAPGGGAGGGGLGGATLDTQFRGAGGGAGWLGNGSIGSSTGAGPGGNGGLAPRNGGAGGLAAPGGEAGGFGGGGGSTDTSGACGGGGGFNGGGGGHSWNGTNAWGCGGGGGSFNAGTTPVATAGVRSGNGEITISW